MDAQKPAPSGLDGYFGPVVPADPLDPRWTPSPALQQPVAPMSFSAERTLTFELPPQLDAVAPVGAVPAQGTPTRVPELLLPAAAEPAPPVAPQHLPPDVAQLAAVSAADTAERVLPAAPSAPVRLAPAGAAPAAAAEAAAPAMSTLVAPAALTPAAVVAAAVMPAPVMAPPLSPSVLPAATPGLTPTLPAVTVLPTQEAADSAGPQKSAEGGARLGAEDSSEDSAFLADLLLYVLEHNSSDLHLTVGAHPTIRQHGHLVQLEDFQLLTPQLIQKTMYAIMSQKQREKFEEELELDFAYSLPGKARFRVNVYKQRDAVGAAFRLIPYEIKRLEDLGVPPAVSNFAMLPRGFVLVTGPTGSGKSTTLAAVVDMANRQRADHIMTCEDPIEFLHQHKKCLVNQREVGEDTWSFKNALKHVLRQDPDIILVGEMRDLETIEIALTAAETGHLVMATLHTQDAAQTIDRVIDVFPPQPAAAGARHAVRRAAGSGLPAARQDR